MRGKELPTESNMQKTSPWLIATRVLFTFALIACIVFIFSNSMQIADVSSVASGRALTLMRKVFTRLGMPGMSENPFDKVFLVAPAGTEAALAERLTEKARYHFDAVLCPSLADAVKQAKANSRRGLLVCGSEAIALEAEKLLSDTVL